jgi:uncharacterized protein YbaA (DUF1428 family)
MAESSKEADMYVDGFVMAVRSEQKEAFLRFEIMMAGLFKEYGALQVADCWGDDVPEGKLTSFPMAVKLEPGETVVFGWITWPDKPTRDKGMAGVSADPRCRNEDISAIFDPRRIILGGFVPMFPI